MPVYVEGKNINKWIIIRRADIKENGKE